jgi:hypothetical protein
MANLVPEVRNNKNGVPVKKWVTPQSDTSSRAALPAPSAGAASLAKEKRVWHLHARLSEMPRQYKPKPSFKGNNAIRNRMLQWDDSTLQAIEDALNWNDATDSNRGSVIDGIVEGGRESIIKERLRYLPAFSPDTEEGPAFEMIRGLNFIEHFHGHDISEMDGEKFELAKAYLRVTEAIIYGTDHHDALNDSPSGKNRSIMAFAITGRFIADPELSDLIAEYPEKAAMMADFIYEREMTDAVLIRKYIEDGTALREGML